MSTSPKIAFISDLHLDPSNAGTAMLFQQFMESAQAHIDELYILGDLVEYWVGDDDHSAFTNKLVEQLKSFSKTHKLFFMRGNRDFLVGSKFAKRTGAKILRDPHLLTHNQHKYLLMHGDLLCSLDKVYLKRRAFYTHPVTKFFLYRLPLKKRIQMAENLRKQSGEHKSDVTESIMDVYPATVEKYIQQNNATHLIHGHTHRPGEHTLIIEGREVKRTVLGAWHNQGSVILLKDSGAELDFFTNKESIDTILQRG